MSTTEESKITGSREVWSDTSDSSNDTDRDEGLSEQDRYWKYMKKIEKKEYKAKKLAMQIEEMRARANEWIKVGPENAENTD